MIRLDFTHAIQHKDGSWKLFGIWDDGSVQMITSGDWSKIKKHDNQLMKRRRECDIVTSYKKEQS